MTQVVYFAGAPEGPIKIGFTVGLEKRLATIQTGYPERIDLLAQVDGDRKTEAFLHSLVSKHRLYGEWFARNEPVLTVLNNIKTHGIDFIPEMFRARPYEMSMAGLRDQADDIVASARNWIEELAQPMPFGEHMSQTLTRVAATAGVSRRTLKSIWYDECTTMKAEVFVGLQDAFNAKMARMISQQTRAGV